MAESFPDIKAFDIKSSNSSQEDTPLDPIEQKTKFRPEDIYYDMNGEKLLFIFNHTTFDKESVFYKETPPADIIGTEEDVSKLESTFSALGFKVTVFNDQTLHDLRRRLSRSEFNSNDVSCLCVVILTQSYERRELCSYDRPYDFKQILEVFRERSQYRNDGKPMLFFVQASCGKMIIDGEGQHEKYVYSENKDFQTIPSHADVLVIRSTVKDYTSYRKGPGSFMIQELCEALSKYHTFLDVFHITTLLQREVALDYSSDAPEDLPEPGEASAEPQHSKKRRDKKMLQTTSTLTKILKL